MAEKREAELRFGGLFVRRLKWCYQTMRYGHY